MTDQRTSDQCNDSAKSETQMKREQPTSDQCSHSCGLVATEYPGMWHCSDCQRLIPVDWNNAKNQLELRPSNPRDVDVVQRLREYHATELLPLLTLTDAIDEIERLREILHRVAQWDRLNPPMDGDYAWLKRLVTGDVATAAPKE